MIETFGPRGRIFKVHFRNVDAPLPRFQESIVDAGYIDMEKVARMLHKTGVQWSDDSRSCAGRGPPRRAIRHTQSATCALRSAGSKQLVLRAEPS